MATAPHSQRQPDQAARPPAAHYASQVKQSRKRTSRHAVYAMAYLFLLFCIIFMVDQEYWIFSDENVVYFGYFIYLIVFANLVFIDVFFKFGGQSVAAVLKPGTDLDHLQRASKHICAALSVTIVLLGVWLVKVGPSLL